MSVGAILRYSFDFEAKDPKQLLANLSPTLLTKGYCATTPHITTCHLVEVVHLRAAT